MSIAEIEEMQAYVASKDISPSYNISLIESSAKDMLSTRKHSRVLYKPSLQELLAGIEPIKKRNKVYVAKQ